MRTFTASFVLIGLIVSMFLVPHYAEAQNTNEPQPLINDALTPPPPSRSGLQDNVSDSRGPSQFMAGEVAINLILPESDGSGEPSLEDWTPAQIEAIRSEVQEALDWWEARLPLAGLTFNLRLTVVPTAYEPITHGLYEEYLWISDTMNRLGHTGWSYFDQVYNADYALRDELGSDWATTIFIINSHNDGDGYMPDGHFAYAYINGPFMVLTSDAGGYGQHRLAPVVAHELGHIFGALDEYAAARVPCTMRSGYLYTPTSNSSYQGCGTNLPSIMREPVSAFINGQVSPSALAQLGYVDSDDNGVIDPLDTTPTLQISDFAQRLPSGRPVVTGTGNDQGFPSPWLTTASINPISAVEYRIDGGTWQAAIPNDGSYDDSTESFSAELPLYDGTHTVEFRARNSQGHVSESITHEFVVNGLGARNRSIPLTHRPALPATRCN
jgi:hypothetical protein